MDKGEIIMRLNLLSTNIQAKLDERATLDYVKSQTDVLENKIWAVDGACSQISDSFDRLQSEQDHYVVLVDEIKSTLAQKLELSALSPIWKHFDRFALYEDLKILHNKVMPEIQKFEERLISCDQELQKTSMIRHLFKR